MKKTIIVFVALSFCATANSSELGAVLRNNDGVRKYMQKNSKGAFDGFADALGDLPFSGAVHYNLGNAFMANQEPNKALSEYREAMRLAPGDSPSDKEIRFRSLFNAAVALTGLKKTDEALDLYQKALEIKPDSLETKTNIELLTQGQGGGGDNENENQDDKSEQGDKEDKKDKEGQGKDDKENKQPKNPEKFENPKPKPRPFQSEQLSQQDVGRILEELKRQEEQIRARMQNEGAKDAPPDKDW